MKRHIPKDRPPPLKISRPSNPHHLNHSQPVRPGGHRQPVIIHTYSPEVIEIESDKFRQLVQRLTGPGAHTSPPAKRVKFGPPGPANPNLSTHQEPPHAAYQPLPLWPARSPRGGLRQPPVHPNQAGDLQYNPLLSPSFFDFSSPRSLSPSAFPFILPSPRGLRGLPLPSRAGGLPGPSPRGLPTTPWSLFSASLPSPGPLSAKFLADLPALSPAAAFAGTELNAWPADMTLASRYGLPPRPPPTTTANLFPQSPPVDHHQPEEKPFVLYRDKYR